MVTLSDKVKTMFHDEMFYAADVKQFIKDLKEEGSLKIINLSLTKWQEARIRAALNKRIDKLVGDELI